MCVYVQVLCVFVVFVVCVYIYVCVFVCLFVFVSERVCACLCACLHACVCICVCVCFFLVFFGWSDLVKISVQHLNDCIFHVDLSLVVLRHYLDAVLELLHLALAGCAKGKHDQDMHHRRYIDQYKKKM